MKAGYFIVLFVLVAVGWSAPHEKKRFHEHVEDFIGLIIAESGLQLELLLKQYGESQDFGITANYMRSPNFRDVLHDMESLPEYKAVQEYLEKAHIDIKHMLEHVDELIDHNESVMIKPNRHKDGDHDMTDFIRKAINILPKQKLADLFEQKEKEYPKFRHSMEKFKSEEWQRLYQALWESQEFKKAENILAENGLDVRLLIEQIKAVFGQN